MANYSDIAIRIAADFVGIPAFKKADTAVDKLYKTTKKLAVTFGATFSAAAVARYGASAVRAFAAEERQIASLTATVKSLGLGFRSTDVNTFIEDLERLTGVAREQLQPAFQRLLSQTGSITKAQKILTTAVKVSMSGLMSTEEAANALTQAYVGNVKGLKQFNLGLTNAQLAGMSFDEILQKVATTYNSQFNEALDTTQVKIDKLNVALGNTKEAIGGGLVKAFSDLAGNGNIDKANSKLETFGNTLGTILGNLFNPVQVKGFFLPIPNLLAKQSQATGAGIGFGKRISPQQIMKERKIEKDAALKLLSIEKQKASALAKQTIEKKAQAALDKAALALSTAGNIFDLERIGIAAAMQNQNLTENERKRLEIKQAIFNLEDAIATKDTAKITAATNLLNGLTSQFAIMQKQDALLGQIKTAFDSLGLNKDLINIDNLQKALDLLLKMQGIKISPMTTTTTSTGAPTFASVGNKLTSFAGSAASAFNTLTPAEKDLLGGYAPFVGSNVPPVNPISYGGSGAGLGNNGTGLQVPPQVVIQITDNAQKLVDMVTFATQNNSANGTPVALNRNATNLAW